MSCALHKRAFINALSGCANLLAFPLSQTSFAKNANGNRYQKACQRELMSAFCSPATRPLSCARSKAFKERSVVSRVWPLVLAVAAFGGAMVAQAMGPLATWNHTPSLPQGL